MSDMDDAIRRAEAAAQEPPAAWESPATSATWGQPAAAPEGQPVTPLVKRRWAQLVAVGLLGLIVGGMAGYAVASAGPSASQTAADRSNAVEKAAQALAEERAAAEAAAEAQASALAEQAAQEAPPPAPSAFRLTVKILEKKCYGSAGCNVSFRVVPEFVGPGDPNSLEVTYEVLGDESGPQVNTFTIDSAGTIEYDSEESLSTASSRTRITARVIEVRRA